MKYKKISKFSAILLTLLLIFTFSVSAQSNIENMNFKNADLVDVLRAIAEVADVNLITDNSVSGTITVNLKNISFKKSLDLITKSRALDYRWDDNTVVVASPDRLDQIYSNIETRFVKVDNTDLENIVTIIKEIFPETQITLDAPRRQMILKGEKSKVVEIEEMINRLASAEIGSGQSIIYGEEGTVSTKPKELFTKKYLVLNAELEDLKTKLNTVNPALNITLNPLTEQLIIKGLESEVKNAISMAKTYDQSLEPETRNIRVDYVDTEQITEIVGKFYPEIKLHVNAKRKEIILNGAKNKLDSVVSFIRSINVPRQQVIIETRVEEISDSKLRELGVKFNDGNTLSRIHFIKDIEDPDGSDDQPFETSNFGKIEEIELTWPDFFEALDEKSDSETLANPHLMTLNGEKATMEIKDEVPYKVVTEDDGEDETTYEYVEAGVILEFTPWITENNEIELEIAPEVSSFIAAATDEGAPPAKKSRKIETKLRLKDGETFAIGGLIQTDKSGAISKIPLLGDIPIFGEIFKYRDNNSSRNELLIFVTPRIIKNGQNVTKDHLINNQEKIEMNSEKNDDQLEKEKTKEEIIKEYLEKRSENRKEILNSLKTNKDKKEYQDLTPAELEEILAD